MPQRREVTFAETGDRPEIRCRPRDQPPERDHINIRCLQFAGRPHTGRITKNQQPDHQPRVIGRTALLLLIRGVDTGQVQMFINQIGNEPGHMISCEPLIQ